MRHPGDAERPGDQAEDGAGDECRSALRDEIRWLAASTGKRTAAARARALGVDRSTLYRYLSGQVPPSDTMKRMLQHAVEAGFISPRERELILRVHKGAVAEKKRADAVSNAEPTPPASLEPTTEPATGPTTEPATEPATEPEPKPEGPPEAPPPRPPRRWALRTAAACTTFAAVATAGWLGVRAVDGFSDRPGRATSTAVAAEYRAHAAFYRSLQHFVLTDSAEDGRSAVLEFRIDGGPTATRWNKSGSRHTARTIQTPPITSRSEIEYRVCVAPYRQLIPEESCGQWTTDLPSKLNRALPTPPSRSTAAHPSAPHPADRKSTCHWKVIRQTVGVYEDPTRSRLRLKTKTKGKVVGPYCRTSRNIAEGATYVAVKTETATDGIGWINVSALTPAEEPKEKEPVATQRPQAR
ncbi:hypothetical protein ETD83_10780 [Actinomadura soli]|uniref:Uncharacterized protein n=1 Tax=Actinomadura soli TaxID=2508997 RepID=A0A5C4JF14_9ACTN|nr:hypothetical protein [Actinomadura soli]TMR03385.1 hypothetical protein ETD83_10780 [Actinomadura soli]